MHRHNEGKASRYTRTRLPAIMVFMESCENRSQALKRECEIKKLKKVQKEELVNRVSLDPASHSVLMGLNRV